MALVMASALWVEPAAAQQTADASAQQTADAPAQQSDQSPEANPTGLEEITVTARRREENLQNVPVQASVVTPAVLQASGTFTPSQLQFAAPGLMVTPFNGDRSNIILTIRGQAYSTGSLFPAVYPYFSEVPLTKLTTGNF